MKEFKQVRENLLDMLEDLDEKLGKITDEETISVNPDTADNNNPAIESENDLENSMRNEIKNIEHAISQIDSGTYGICLSCGKTIKKEYLNNAPFSSHCIHCAEKKNGN